MLEATLALGTYNRLLGLMANDGFRPEAAMFAFSSALSLALGAVLVERMMGGHHSIPVQRLALVKGMIAEMPQGSYPRIAAAAPQFHRWSFDSVFDLGLQSLVTGLEERCARHRPRKRGRRLA